MARLFITFYLLLLFGFFTSCSEPKARRPIANKSGYDQSASIAFNKKLYQIEEDVILNYIKKDSLHHYINSQHGFWYVFLDENKTDSIFPKKGDWVTFQYEIKDIKNNEIYSAQELGIKKYKVDQEEMIQGIQEGIKWLNKNEKAIFVLPSHKAYAHIGDENKIAPNTPIIVTIHLLEINP